MKNKRKLSARYIVMIVIVVIVIILVIFSKTLKDDRKLNTAESLLKDSVSFVERIVLMPFNYICDIARDFGELKNVKKENDNLKSSIDRIDAIETENIELRKEIEELKKELNVDYVLSDYDKLNATVISRNIGYWYNTITIDKGTYNGIDEDMVVVNSSGLIGKVVRATTFTSDVRLVTTSDTNNKISISITNGDNKINGLVKGFNYKENKLEVEGISNTEEVNIGDKVYTSGLGGIFPSGILIGNVESITTDEYDLSKIILVTPSANFDDINYVTVLKRKDIKE